MNWGARMPTTDHLGAYWRPAPLLPWKRFMDTHPSNIPFTVSAAPLVVIIGGMMDEFRWDGSIPPTEYVRYQ